jgi:hypothetical protein
MGMELFQLLLDQLFVQAFKENFRLGNCQTNGTVLTDQLFSIKSQLFTLAAGKAINL